MWSVASEHVGVRRSSVNRDTDPTGNVPSRPFRLETPSASPKRSPPQLDLRELQSRAECHRRWGNGSCRPSDTNDLPTVRAEIDCSAHRLRFTLVVQPESDRSTHRRRAETRALTCGDAVSRCAAHPSRPGSLRTRVGTTPVEESIMSSATATFPNSEDGGAAWSTAAGSSNCATSTLRVLRSDQPPVSPLAP